MARKAPRVGDLVLWQADGRSIGWVASCQGIHIVVRFFDSPPDREHGCILRRDKVEVLSSANPIRP